MIYSPAMRSYGQTANIAAALAVVFAVPAILCFILAFSGDSLEVVPLGIGVALLAATAVIWSLIRKTVLSIHAEGVRRVSAFGSKELLWDEISEYRYQEIPVQVGGAVGGLVGAAIQAAYEKKTGKKTKSLVLTLQGRDGGKKIKVTSNFKDAEEAIAEITGKLHARMKPAAMHQIDNHGEAAFGQLRLSRRGIAWKGKEPIPWEDVAKAEMAGRKLRIRRKGKMLDALSVGQANIPNLLLALELINMFRNSASMAPVVEAFA